ncbi:pseudouridine synthase [Algoriphagus hitonicola]|uniref:tRNA pseudouridine synthase C n=1 Tax=Algoriphagus hitonicola TaxID=435880 RepID=A0A1I2RMI3_9BACT|nr:pseudouridine synthase [Algoriphagus hitonicola]SFG40689.1 tRNA pseudouridine synthase C [Algoriphagus hitonicola]
MLEIIHEDEHLIAINKPAGLLVHRTSIAAEEQSEFAVQKLRDQIGSKVYPAHRIDRPTSGVLLFAKNPESLPLLKVQFAERLVSKKYLALVRGYLSEKEGRINYPLENERSKKLQEAITDYKVLEKIEIPFDTTGRYPTSRYSLVEMSPLTGRTHQIRRHLAHLRHYIIGDKKHGNNKQNHFFFTQFGLENLLLHAYQLELQHPWTKQEMSLKASIPDHFRTILTKIEMNSDLIQ